MTRRGKITAIALILVMAIGFLMLRVSGSPAVAPVQPIEYSHWQHVAKAGGPELACDFCHENADKSPHATIPNITTCMACHLSEKTDSPEVQKLAAIAKRKEQPKWVRVYFFEPEADVFFSHKPHIKAQVDCKECHGDPTKEPRVKREVNQTMGWCINCHRQRGASIDCSICHR